jgi:hypothetical protein
MAFATFCSLLCGLLSKHSHKALQRLHQRIALRRTWPTGQLSFDSQAIDDRARECHHRFRSHLKHIVFRYWRLYVAQCKKALRSGNTIAREFWNSEKAEFSQCVVLALCRSGRRLWRISALAQAGERFESQKCVELAMRPPDLRDRM